MSSTNPPHDPLLELIQGAKAQVQAAKIIERLREGEATDAEIDGLLSTPVVREFGGVRFVAMLNLPIEAHERALERYSRQIEAERRTDPAWAGDDAERYRREKALTDAHNSAMDAAFERQRRGEPLSTEDRRLLSRPFYWEEHPGGIFITVPPPGTPAEEVERRRREFEEEVKRHRDT